MRCFVYRIPNNAVNQILRNGFTILFFTVSVLGITIQSNAFSEYKDGSSSSGNSYSSLISKAKGEYFSGRYNSAEDLFSRAQRQNPQKVEPYHYLAAIEERELFTGDFFQTFQMNVEKVKEISSRYEKMAELIPHQDTERNFYPELKLNYLWGQFALSYAVQGDADSTKAAFQLGKKHGAFSTVSLEYGRNVLKSAEKNAIIIGQISDTYSLYYLQTVEGLRTDVSVIDYNLASSRTYVENFLQQANPATASCPQAQVQRSSALRKYDLHDFRSHDMELTMSNGKVLSWTLHPNRYGLSLNPRDVTVLNLIAENGGKRPIYFLMNSFDSQKVLGLDDYMVNTGLLYKLTSSKNDTGLEVDGSGIALKFNNQWIVERTLAAELNDFMRDYYFSAYLIPMMKAVEHELDRNNHGRALKMFSNMIERMDPNRIQYPENLTEHLNDIRDRLSTARN